MKRILIIVFTLVCSGFLFSPTHANAGELDILLEKLVDKGYLTPIEATIIKDETKQQVAAEVGDGKSYAVPTWAQKLKIKQDLRLRWQKEKRQSDVKYRQRARIRYRMGIITNPFKDIEIGAGFATGSDDPRSTNQTLEGVFQTKNINLDYAYAEWKAAKDLKVVGGKFKRKPYLWAPTDLLWDGDINPEGFSVNYQRDVVKNVKGFVNFGWWNLDDRDQDQHDSANPFMYYAQLGKKFKKGDVDTTFAATVYKFSNVKGNDITDGGSVDVSEGTNTTSGGRLVHDYDAKVLSGEIGLKNPFGFDSIERFAVFGDYVRNYTISKDNAGWASGFKFGHKKVAKKGNWQFKYIYAELQKDAWLDTFPDSDRYGGKTDVKSHEVILQYALRKNMILGFDFYKSQRLDNGKNEEVLGQLDLVLKF